MTWSEEYNRKLLLEFTEYMAGWYKRKYDDGIVTKEEWQTAVDEFLAQR